MNFCLLLSRCCVLSKLWKMVPARHDADKALHLPLSHPLHPEWVVLAGLARVKH
jgi:hypothetical protein